MGRKNKKTESADLSVQSSKKKRSAKKIIIRVLIVILVIVTLLSITVAALLTWRPLDEAPAEPATGTSTEPVTEEEFKPSKNTEYFLICGLDESEKLTDVIMVVCYQYEQNTANILQIPRDTIVSRDFSDGTHKINSVYSNADEGERNIDALIRCLDDQLNIQIDHYATVTLSGLRDIVDTVGGVEIDNPKGMYVENHRNGQMVWLEEGKVTLDGNLAESFIRSRKNYVQGDIGRLQAQRQFYAAFIEKVINMSIFQSVRLVTSLYDDVTTDLSVGEMIRYANHVRGMDLTQVEIAIAPGRDYTYDGFSCWAIHKESFVEMYNSMMNPEGVPFTVDDLNLPDLVYSASFDGEGTTIGEIVGIVDETESESESGALAAQ